MGKNKKYFIPALEDAKYPITEPPLIEDHDKMWAEAAAFEKKDLLKAFSMPKVALSPKVEIKVDAMKYQEALKEAIRVVTDKKIAEMTSKLWEPSGKGAVMIKPKSQFEHAMEDWIP